MRTESKRAAPSNQEATGSQTFAKARKRSMLPKEFDDGEEEEDFWSKEKSSSDGGRLVYSL